MAILAIAAALLVIGLVTLPQFWVRRAIRKHAVDRPDLPGTGGELARHLLDRFDLASVPVEETDRGDHFDPAENVVRLSPETMSGRSVSAVAIAAHEVGHALQHAAGDKALARRQRLATVAQVTDRIAAIFFLAAPVLTVLARSPLALAATVGVGIALLGVRVLFTLVTLPVEHDASFAKALPILRDGGYLHDGDMPAATSVLRAAAFTYVASALMTLVDLARWIRLVR